MDFLHGKDFSLGPLLATFFLGFTTLVLLIVYSIRKQRYWEKIGIPYVKPFPIFGSLVENVKKPFHEIELEHYDKYGRIYGHYEGNRALISVAEPELLRQILVKDFQAFTGRRVFDTGDRITDNMVSILTGEDWKRVRTIITPTFTTGKIKRMMGVFKDCCRTLIQNFKEAAKKGKPIKARELYGAFSMDVIASSAFSTKIDSHNDPNNRFVKTAQTVFSTKVSWRFLMFSLWPSFMQFFKIAIFPPKGVEFFKDVTLQIIEERKRTGQTRNDFLQLLLDTAKELKDEGKLDENEEDDMLENYGRDEKDQIFKNYYTKKSLSMEELVAQCVIFFLAGYHTTAYTLAYTSYCLALNPEIQEKVIQELDDALRENNGELTYEAVQSMKYMDNVISEALRIYPPATRTERLAEEDYKLGDTGINVPKGMVITIPICAMHKDPELYPDPEKFDPDRFTPEERAKRDPYTYLPFGQGPRNCLGMRFALMEMKVCLAHVLSNFRLKRCPETKVPLDFHIGPNLLMAKDITLALEERKDTVKAL